jgi:DNA-binding transcriptional regulator YdaS (Cro superfamily)
MSKLKDFLSAMDGDEREAFARRCGTSRGHLQNVMYGLRTCATDLAVAIERESWKAVRRWDLRADWRNHWPELIGKHERGKNDSTEKT